MNETKFLLQKLQTLNAKEIGKLMGVSDNIAALNYERFQNFNEDYASNNNLAPAIYAFKGDVYQQLILLSYNKQQLQYLQQNLLIISGLYGLLRAFDLLYPYRLEMGTNIRQLIGQNLYEFWQEKLTNYLNQQADNLIVNLASNEYNSVIIQDKLNQPIININFQEYRNGKYKTIGINAKRARGQFLNWMVINNVQNYQQLKEFTVDNYQLNLELSDEFNLIFTK